MKTIEIVVSRRIPAPAEKVFSTWIDPHSPGGPWFGAERVILDAQVDGLFFFSTRWQERSWPHYGRFLQLHKPTKVEHTWMSEATRGLESIVEISFEAHGEETEVTLRHSGVPDDEMGRQHRDGWSWMLNALAEGMAGARAGRSS